jgi:hypothetical protein
METMGPQRDDEQELTRRLEAYADARLRPDPAAMARMRAAVVAEASRTAPAPIRRRSWRFGAALLAAAVLVVAMAGVAAASQPGGPLYGTRLWVETLTLPADPAARTESQLTRLDQRLQEVEAAVAAHDAGAAAAAIDAYRSILDEMLSSMPASATVETQVQAEISKHLTVLEALRLTAPTDAQDGLQNAIEHSDDGLQRLEQRSNDGSQNGAAPGQNGAAPGQNGAAPGQSSAAPGQNGAAPGQSSAAPGQSSAAPGQTSQSPRPSTPAASNKPAKP